MPLTDFQREVLAVIVANRSEASHFAGGLVLNAAETSARYSKDLGWIGNDPTLRVHHGTIGGCWPRVHAADEP